MHYSKAAVLFAAIVSLSACGDITDKTVDQNFGDRSSGSLSEMTAGIWVDPEGCEHWMIDDGLEGYMDLRRTPDGKPVCNSELPRNTATGPYKSGSSFLDIL